MRGLVWAFAGRAYHIVGNLMLRLISSEQLELAEAVVCRLLELILEQSFTSNEQFAQSID